MRTYDDWKTEQMIQAEHGLDDAVDQAYRDMYKADDLLDELAAEDERRATDWAAKCREYANRDDVSPAWKTVIEKVDSGELTWHDIASGAAMDHPAVSAAVADDGRLRAPDTTEDEAPDDDTYYDDFRVLGKRRH